MPSGVWAQDEYEKLPPYDGETFEQPPGVFLCHQQNGRICAGWAGCHDMSNNLALRLVSITKKISDEDLDATLDYTTSTPLFESGAEAAEHGMAEIATPADLACRVIDKLERKRTRRSAS